MASSVKDFNLPVNCGPKHVCKSLFCFCTKAKVDGLFFWLIALWISHFCALVNLPSA